MSLKSVLMTTIGKSPPRGFTVLELLIVLAVLSAFIIPFYDAVCNAKFQGRSASCRTNLKEIGLGVMDYRTTHQEQMPPNLNTLIVLCKSEGLFVCPVTAFADLPNYTIRSYTYRSLSHPQDSDIICWDSGPHIPDHSIFVWRNRPYRDVLYANGRVAILPEEQFEKQHLAGETLDLTESHPPFHYPNLSVPSAGTGTVSP